MGRIISPSLGSSRLSRRHGQRIGFAPNSPYLFSGSGPVWSPASLSNLVQRFLDANPTYHALTLQSFPILSSEETGTVAVPRGQRCALFDGVNDFGTLGARLTSGSPTALTVCCWVKTTASAGMIASENDDSISQRSWHISVASGQLSVYLSSDGSFASAKNYNSTTAINTNVWVHVGFTFSPNNLTLYINGSVATTTSTQDEIVNSIFNSASHFGIGARRLATTPANFFAGSLRDIRIYNVAKSPSEIAAIANQHLTPSTIDTAGLLAMYPMQAESGTIGYDVSGNGRHLTLTNITQATFHAVDSGVNWNYNNWRGYTLSGAVVIPASLSTPTQDAAGNALGVAGAVAKPATVEVPCVTFADSMNATLASYTSNLTNFTICCWIKNNQATGVRRIFSHQDGGTYIGLVINSGRLTALSSAEGVTYPSDGTHPLVADDTWHHVAVVRDTANSLLRLYVDGVQQKTLTASTSSYNFTARLDVGSFIGAGEYYAGGLSDVQYFSVAKTASELQSIMAGVVDSTGKLLHWPMQEGGGTANTNRTIYDTVGTNHLTLVNGTVSSIWANRCPFARDWCIEYGGGIAANGAFVPGRIGSNLDAAGNVKTLVAGKHGNPYSRINRNRWSAPELVNIGITSSDSVAPSTNVQAASVVDTQFARRKTDGSDRYFASRTALTGPDKTNAEGYVA